MGVVHLRIGEELGVRDVGALAPHWLDAVRAPVEVHLDISSLQRCDTAGVQLILMLRREAHASGARLKLCGTSGALRELLRFYRLEKLLDDRE